MDNLTTLLSTPMEDILAKWCEIHSPSSSTHQIDLLETSAAPSPSIILKPSPSPLMHLSNCAGPQITDPLHLPVMDNWFTPMSSPKEDIPAKWHDIHSPSSSTHQIDLLETSAAPSPSIILKPSPSPLTHLSNCAGPQITGPLHLPVMDNWYTPMSSPKEDIPTKWHDIHSPSSSTHLIDPPEISAHPSPPIILNSHPFPLTHLSNCTAPQITGPLHLTDMDNSMIPMPSHKEDIHAKCRQVHSPSGRTRLIDPADSLFSPQEIVRYGEFAEATTMAFKLASYCGSCQHHLGMILEQIRLNKHGYKVAKFIYAHIDGPSWMPQRDGNQSEDTNLIGYVAFSDNYESRRIGRRDIAVVWRGTKALLEWFKDVQIDLVPFGQDADVKVASGFHSIYKSKSSSSSHNNLSASEQVMEEVNGLVKSYKEKGEEVGLTITGHSLGGALSILNAYEAASYFLHHNISLNIRVISFGAPRVGNGAFRDKLKQMQVKTLRVVIEQDVIPMLPGSIIKKKLENFLDTDISFDWAFKLMGKENALFKHVGTELPLHADRLTMPQAHHLKTYLSLVKDSDSSASKLPCGCSAEYGIVEQISVEK